MNSSSPGDSGDPHATTQQLIPWFLSGTLGGQERTLVEEHLSGCAQCRADLAWERSLRSACTECAPALDPDAALARLLPKLARPERRPGILARCARALAANDATWLRPVAAVQLAVIAVLAVLLAGSSGEQAPYRGLGQAPQAQGRLVIMFRPATPEAELRRILQANRARIVDGPTVADAYVLDVPGADLRPALARMRAEPGVAMVQPLTREGAQ